MIFKFNQIKRSLLAITVWLYPTFSFSQGDTTFYPYDFMRRFVVAIGELDSIPVPLNDIFVLRKHFRVRGTGVVFESPKDMPVKKKWLVTARHVFYSPPDNWDPESLRIRFSWDDGKTINEKPGFVLHLKRDGKHLWVSHSNLSIDLACIAIPTEEIGNDTTKIAVIPPTMSASSSDIYEGNEVVAIGYPAITDIFLYLQSVIRFGFIAWTLPVSPELNEIMIDCNLSQGHSGGPVFVKPKSNKRMTYEESEKNIKFLGIATSVLTDPNPITLNGEEVLNNRSKYLSKTYTGLSVIKSPTNIWVLLQAAFSKN